MSTASQIIRDYALQQVGGPYIYGATAQKCTPSYRRARQAQYPKYANIIARMCPVLSGQSSSCSICNYNGMLAHDCAQLTRWAAAAAGLKLPSGSKSQWTAVKWLKTGTIDTLPGSQVAFLYRVTASGVPHTGIYTGDGFVVDARGHREGVRRTLLASYGWTHWAILPGMEDAITIEEEIKRGMTLKNGDRGSEVKAMQEQLIRIGCNLGKWGADGVFGAATEKAVKEFQSAAGHQVTGIWTDDTQAVMDMILKGDPVPGSEDSDQKPEELALAITLPRGAATALLEALRTALS